MSTSNGGYYLPEPSYWPIVGSIGIFLLLVTVAYRGPGAPADALPHALVLTGIVVAVAPTALALVLGRRLRGRDHG